MRYTTFLRVSWACAEPADMPTSPFPVSSINSRTLNFNDVLQCLRSCWASGRLVINSHFSWDLNPTSAFSSSSLPALRTSPANSYVNQRLRLFSCYEGKMRDFAAEELGDYILLYRRVPSHYAAIPMRSIHKTQVSFRTSCRSFCSIDGLCKTAHLPSCSSVSILLH